MGTKLQLEIKGLEELSSRITKLGGNSKDVAEKALKETHEFIAPKVQAAMQPHNRTGGTEKQIIKTAKVEWSGTVATMVAGFDLSDSLVPIYLKEGTRPHVIKHHNGDNRGTPRNHPGTTGDSKLKKAVSANANKSKIIKIQEDVFYSAIRKLGG